MKRKALICAALAACMVLSGCSDLGKVFQFRTNVVANNVLNGEATKQYKTAIMNGNIEWIEEIIANNPDLDINYCEDETALYCACFDSGLDEYRKSQIVTTLLESGVEPNVDNILQLTTYNKKYWLTKSILQVENIDLSTSDSIGNTPLSLANENQDTVTLLLSFRTTGSDTEAGLQISNFTAENSMILHSCGSSPVVSRS